jgi:hypothetical protein
MLDAMQSVDAILNKVYGGKAQAHAALGGSRSSPWNWAKNGHFPAAVAIKISLDAKERGIDLALDEIPTQKREVAQ